MNNSDAFPSWVLLEPERLLMSHTFNAIAKLVHYDASLATVLLEALEKDFPGARVKYRVWQVTRKVT